MRRGRFVTMLALVIALGVSGCVNHYCGPASHGSADPFCSIHWPPPPT
jgi:hypothetical protein